MPDVLEKTLLDRCVEAASGWAQGQDQSARQRYSEYAAFMRGKGFDVSLAKDAFKQLGLEVHPDMSVDFSHVVLSEQLHS